MDVYFDEVDEFLEHFGVMGMHWGHRKDRAPGVSKGTDNQARKDAEEFARAQMFFGEGAGTRRKLIRNRVDTLKKNPDYRKAFEHHLSRQDMSEHVSKAKSERKRKDVAKTTKQRAGFIARKLTGEFGTQAAFTAIIIGGAAFLNSSKGRQIMQTSVKKINDFKMQRRGQQLLNNVFRMQS
jgi:hypothetical protein